MSPWVPRVGLVVLGVALLAAVVSISIGERSAGTFDIEGQDSTQSLYSGIRQQAERLGRDDAPVEIELFIDLRSVPDARFASEVVDPVVKEYVRDSDRAQIDLRHRSIGRTEITEAAIAATAAGEQGRQWQFSRLVLFNLDEAGPDGADAAFLRQVAELTPQMELAEWEEALDDPASRSIPEADAALATELRLPAQPAMVVTGPGGSEELVDSPTLEEVRAAIERVSVSL